MHIGDLIGYGALRLHTPTPDPREDEKEPDVKEPPVPPDQEPEVVPVEDPPKPGGDPPPLIAS
jgi:hypothetical protein